MAQKTLILAQRWVEVGLFDNVITLSACRVCFFELLVFEKKLFS